MVNLMLKIFYLEIKIVNDCSFKSTQCGGLAERGELDCSLGIFNIVKTYSV